MRRLAWSNLWNLTFPGQRASRSVRKRATRRCRLEQLVDRVLLCGDGNLSDALPIGPSDVVLEEFSADDQVGLFRFTLDEPGRLTIQTRPEEGSELETRTSLMEAEGRLLIQSVGQSASNPDDLIVQHLLPGTYFLRVEGLGDRTGDYALITQFEPASPPNEPLLVNFDHDYPFGLSPNFHVTADFNGDGHLDMATANTLTNDVSVLFGLGDGTFQSAVNFGAGEVLGPYGIAAGDFNNDGFVDLSTTNLFSNDVSVLLGSVDGTFVSQPPVPVGTTPLTLTAADFTGDGILDLAVANGRDNDVSLLVGHGDGTFEDRGRFATGNFPSYLAFGDFDGDQRLDLAVANFNSNDVSLLRGLEGGTFAPEVRIATVSNPSTLVPGDFNHDGHLDLVGVNTGSDNFSIHWGQGDGTFVSETQGATGAAPIGLVSADFNGDGLADLAASNRHSTGVSVLLARPDGTFADQIQYGVGLQPWYVIAGDFNEDGHPDLATANARSHDVSILLGLGDGTFQPDPTGLRQGETNPQGMAARDFNDDGILDLAAVSYTGGDLFIFLGRGDGTFHERMRFRVGSTPVELLAEDFDGDGHDDLATINCDAGNVSVLLGRGDGTFQDQVSYGSSLSGEFGVTGDFNGDGQLDIVASGQFATGIAFVPGQGDGTFGERTFFATDEAPADGVAGDFNEDGRLDLATTNFFSPDHDVSIHLGRGDGSFEPPQQFAVGESPLGVVVGDFNADGHLDLVNANLHSEPGSVSLLAGRGDGTFDEEVRFATGPSPDFLLTRDVNNDGWLDLVVSNAGASDVSLLLGLGNGTFQEQVRFNVGDGPTPRRGLDAGDFNGDGRLDLAIPQVLSNDVAVLAGSGDGHFAEPLRFPVGLGPVAIVTGDFSGDGPLDMASVNPTTNQVTIQRGAGDTTFLDPQSYQVGASPVAVVQGDFNRDGRLDLATVNFGSSDVSVLLGLGTGAMRDEQRYAVGVNPSALVTGDYNGDGQLDLIVANAGSSDLSILLGQGDGTFRNQLPVAVGDLPQSLAPGDFNRDGRLDLATANYRSGHVTILFGLGNGTFHAPLRFGVGAGPVALLAVDLSGDGVLDLATANYLSHDVSLLVGRGDGTFRDSTRLATGAGPVSLASGDFNGDGRSDLGVANSNSDELTLLLGRGDGKFADPVRRATGDYPAVVVSADFDGDARSDLAIATQMVTEVTILQGLGDATFAAAGTISNPRRATPLVADYNGDSQPDVALLDLSGKILLRLAREGAPGFFDAPRIVNPDPQFAARDLAIITGQVGLALAALDTKNSSVSLYARQSDGTFTRQDGPQVPGKLPVAIRAGDLSGDGLPDLVVAAAGSDQVFIYLQSAEGFVQGAPDYSIDVGVSPSAIELADVDADQRLDIVVTNQFSGDVSVLYNHASDPFCELRVRAGTGLYALVERNQRPVVRSSELPTDVIAGNFDADDRIDLIVTSGGTNHFSILAGSAAGGILNPTDERTFATDVRPTVVVAGRFDNDPYLDLAVLNEGHGNLTVFLGDDQGNFHEQLSPSQGGQMLRLSAGNRPTGLSVHDVNGDGRLDLLVGNEFGDLLTLLGNGDGTFQPYERAGGNIALAVVDVNGDEIDDFVFSNQARDRVTVQYAQSGQTFAQDRDDGLLAPGAVSSADLNRDGWKDLVVANSGANNVLVYLGSGSGQFLPAQSFFAGTKPAGVTIQDLNADQYLDLVVANEGSNDVTILLGETLEGGWTMVSGPRLRAGAGPVSTAVLDATGDAIPDILVSNQQSNNVFLLPGVGLGFFDDRSPFVRDVGREPGQIVSIGSGVATINGRSNDVTFFPSFLGSARFDIASGGARPVAALTGDFNGDGLGDLLVAHQGNGVVSLLVGEASGLSLAQSFFRDDVPHPAALAASRREGAVDIYLANEGQESALLLTSFGIPVPSPGAPPPLPPLLGIFLVAGPGFAVAMDILTSSDPAEVAGAHAQQSGDTPTEETQVADLSAENGAGDATDDEKNKESAETDEDAAARRAIIRLLLGADEALGRHATAAALEKAHQLATDGALAAIDQFVSQCLPTALACLHDLASFRQLDSLHKPVVEKVHYAVDALFDVLGELMTGHSAATGSLAPGEESSDSTAPKAAPSDESLWQAPAGRPWLVDSCLAAFCLAGILGSAWIGEEPHPESAVSKSRRRAQVPRRFGLFL